MPSDEIAAIRTKHVKVQPEGPWPYPYCAADEQPWPCDVVEVLAARETRVGELEARAIRLQRALDDAAQDYHEAREGADAHDGDSYAKCADVRCGEYRAIVEGVAALAAPPTSRIGRPPSDDALPAVDVKAHRKNGCLCPGRPWCVPHGRVQTAHGGTCAKHDHVDAGAVQP